MRAQRRLTRAKIDALTKPGRYSDGGNLYLVFKGGRKSWAFLYRWRGRLREMGLGAYPRVGIREAREIAKDNRASLDAGRDPIRAANIADFNAAVSFDLKAGLDAKPSLFDPAVVGGKPRSSSS